MKINANLAFLAFSVCSVAGYLSCSTGNEDESTNTLALNTFKALGLGLASYAASYLGVHGSMWGYRQLKMNHLKFASNVEWSFNHLSKHQLGTRENFHALLVGNGRYALRICLGIINLDRAGILTKENRAALLTKDGELAENISLGIINLHKARLSTPENKAILLAKGGEFAGDFSLAIAKSHQADRDDINCQELVSLFFAPFALPASSLKNKQSARSPF